MTVSSAMLMPWRGRNVLGVMFGCRIAAKISRLSRTLMSATTAASARLYSWFGANVHGRCSSSSAGSTACTACMCVPKPELACITMYYGFYVRPCCEIYVIRTLRYLRLRTLGYLRLRTLGYLRLRTNLRRIRAPQLTLPKSGAHGAL
jgi:hypothetical protein